MPDTLKKSRLPAFLKAGDERIELPPKVLETPIIPFEDRKSTRVGIGQEKYSYFLKKFEKFR